MVEADTDATESEKGFVDIQTAFVSHAEPAKLMEPADGALHNPAQGPQSAAVVGIAFGDECADAAFGQFGFVSFGVVSAIAKDEMGTPTGTALLSAHRRYCVDEWNELGYVVPVSAGDGEGKWDPLAIGDDVVFGPGFAAIRWIGACLLPPKTARTLEESTTARDQSIWSALFKWANSASNTDCHTPSFCQSRNRRQHVIPHPQPISCGRYSQGMPVRSTNRMPVRALRFGTAGRPLLLGGLSAGRSRSIRVHNSSGRISRAICSSMQPVLVNPDSLALHTMYRKNIHEL